MPAYFSLVFYIKKKNLNKNLFKDFVRQLQKNGFVFKGGFMDFADDTLERILRINTEKLMDNYEVTPNEIRSNYFRQSCWSFKGFSETRLFVTNFREDDYFSFHIIVPEEEVFVCSPERVQFIDSSAASLKSLSLALWKRKYVTAVQACLEGDDDVFLDDIRNGEMPTVKPFAIVPLSFMPDNRELGFLYTKTRRKGVLIERA